MAEPDTQTLIRDNNQPTVVDVGTPPQRPSSSQAYKVAGLTLLACVLIVGQAAIAYFLLSQRSDIKSLEEQNKKIKLEMTSGGRSSGGSYQLHVPMNVMPEMLDTTVNENDSAGSSKTPAGDLTSCQQEAAGLIPVQVPGFKPLCDEQGFYKAQQCFLGKCWCVNRENGQESPCIQQVEPFGELA